MYRLLIMGDENYNDSIKMLKTNIQKAFSRLPIEIFSSPYTKFKNLPEVDFVLLTCYFSNDVEIKAEEIKKQTKCKKICSFSACTFPFLDYGFCFNDITLNDHSMLIHLPANKEILKLTEKKPKTVLIDHYWEPYLNTFDDWTLQIENAVKELTNDGYTFYRMIRFDGEEEKIKPFEIPIKYSDYEEYLEKTKSIETFIVTHKESYSYGVIDMAVRGTRICTPPEFLNRDIISVFNIPTFNNKRELLSILRRPLEHYWESLILKCTDYNDIALMMNAKFRQWMNYD